MSVVTAPPKPIRILVAVSVRLYRDGLAGVLATQASLSVAGTAGTSGETLAIFRTSQPDVVIVDVSLEGSTDLMRTLRLESPTGCILAFAVREDIAAILECAEAGADGFVTANCSIADLVEAIERTIAGELLCSPRLAAQLLRRAAHRPAANPERAAGPSLTSREEQVFNLLKKGHSNKEIAGDLRITEATVKNHVHHILEKLHVTTRGQAAATMREQIVFDRPV